MDRVPEPELMNDPQQARAYAEADFSEPHNRFVELFREAFPEFGRSAWVLDLGCGPADVTLRFARAYPDCRIHGIDGSPAMLKWGAEAVRREGLESRVFLIERLLPAGDLHREGYDAIVSNSLLHHLSDPQVLWSTIKTYARPGAPVFVMDLSRPASRNQAVHLTETYAGSEPDVLKRDFFNSLLAAYTLEEVHNQLRQADLAHLETQAVSDRHLIVYGRR